MTSTKSVSSIYQRPAELLQRLIQFDTTNPPGNESECISFINGLLSEAGIESKILFQKPERSNLVARLTGQGKAPPLLLYGHVDVVTTENQTWQYPPFEGKEADGFIWGRGALDMKGGVAMMLAAFLRAKVEGLKLPGDVILAIVGDEETFGPFGAKYLVENHSDLFDGVRYAISEFGGFTFYIGKKRFYPIQIAEKQVCWMKATVRGPGGHGSMPVHGGAMAKLSRLLQKLDKHPLPVHVTPPARLMINSIASGIGGLSGLIFRQLTNPLLTNSVLKLLGEGARIFDPLLHNVVSASLLRGSDKINVIPSEISVGLDGRLLPGYQPDDLIKELRQIIGNEIEIEVIQHEQNPAEPDMGLFDTLTGILREADPDGIPIPFFLSGTSDARLFSQLGIQTYGFLPMQFPEEFKFVQTIHAADERIPIETIGFGTNAIYELLQRFGG